jgi:predicted dehydrogenase
VPDRFTIVPEGTPRGPAFNVAQAYERFADGLGGDSEVEPDFALALRRHRLLEAMERASDEGRTVSLR